MLQVVVVVVVFDNVINVSTNPQVKRLKRLLRESGISEPKAVSGEADEVIMPKLEKSMSKLRMREEEAAPVDFDELDNLETEINNLKSQVGLGRLWY